MRISRRSFGKALGALPARHFVRYLVPAEAEPTSTTGDRRSVKTPDKVSPWYLNKKRWTTFNIHYQDWNSEIGSRLSSQDIIRNLITCKANVFMMDVGDLYGNLYYPSGSHAPKP